MFFLYIHLPKLTPSNCFLLSWCPLMLGWEDPPGAGKHPHQLGWVEEQREKSQYPDVEEWAPPAMAGRCWGQYPSGCLVAPFIPAQKLQFHCSTTTCARKAVEELLWLVAMSTALSLPAESQVLVGMATLLRTPKDAQWGTGSLEKALGYQWRWKVLCQRAEKTHAITHLFGKVFCRIRYVLGG